VASIEGTLKVNSSLDDVKVVKRLKDTLVQALLEAQQLETALQTPESPECND
jgi:hypothetical protein